eukprot:3080986-Pleurochrysis_carterae.AAC.2
MPRKVPDVRAKRRTLERERPRGGAARHRSLAARADFYVWARGLMSQPTLSQTERQPARHSYTTDASATHRLLELSSVSFSLAFAPTTSLRAWMSKSLLRSTSIHKDFNFLLRTTESSSVGRRLFHPFNLGGEGGLTESETYRQCQLLRMCLNLLYNLGLFSELLFSAFGDGVTCTGVSAGAKRRRRQKYRNIYDEHIYYMSISLRSIYIV